MKMRCGNGGVILVRALKPYLRQAGFVSQAPLIVSPSHAKTAYLEPLLDFFWGINETGGSAWNFAIVGFSLPPHDGYLRQAFYNLVRNYQLVELGKKYPKTRLKVVDLRQEGKQQQELKRNYRFVDWTKTDASWEGFGAEALEFLFD
ncbi:MAG: hypothetical protein GWP08_09350 [Nitrospiraceae bacterium]|nr:hypothetical protein [Nitrospiraceae bacterium]